MIAEGFTINAYGKWIGNNMVFKPEWFKMCYKKVENISNYRLSWLDIKTTKSRDNKC